MTQNGTKVIFVVVFLLAGMLAAAQVQAAETTAASAYRLPSALGSRK